MPSWFETAGVLKSVRLFLRERTPQAYIVGGYLPNSRGVAMAAQEIGDEFQDPLLPFRESHLLSPFPQRLKILYHELMFYVKGYLDLPRESKIYSL